MLELAKHMRACLHACVHIPAARSRAPSTVDRASERLSPPGVLLNSSIHSKAQDYLPAHSSIAFTHCLEGAKLRRIAPSMLREAGGDRAHRPPFQSRGEVFSQKLGHSLPTNRKQVSHASRSHAIRPGPPGPSLPPHCVPGKRRALPRPRPVSRRPRLVLGVDPPCCYLPLPPSSLPALSGPPQRVTEPEHRQHPRAAQGAVRPAPGAGAESRRPHRQ